MSVSREDISLANGGNRYFADVAWELYEDFMREEQPFYGQGVEAVWEASANPFSGKEETILRVRRMSDGVGDVALAPAFNGKAHGVYVMSRNGGEFHGIDLYGDRVSEFKALEVARTVCVARYGVEYRRR